MDADACLAPTGMISEGFLSYSPGAHPTVFALSKMQDEHDEDELESMGGGAGSDGGNFQALVVVLRLPVLQNCVSL